MLRQGRITVDSKVVRSGSTKIGANSIVQLDGIILPEVPLLAVFHKPVGMHSTVGDPLGRRNLEELYSMSSSIKPSLSKASPQRYHYLKSMHPVGRLDADSSGLLLFSRCGQLTQRLLHPSFTVRRVYEALVAGAVQSQPHRHESDECSSNGTSSSYNSINSESNMRDSSSNISGNISGNSSGNSGRSSSMSMESTHGQLSLDAQLQQGVATAEGTFSAELRSTKTLRSPPDLRAAQEQLQRNQEQFHRAQSQPREHTSGIPNNSSSVELGDVDAGLRDGDSTESVMSLVRLSVTEGKYRMVRRMLHNAGHSVLALHRISYGACSLAMEDTPPVTRDDQSTDNNNETAWQVLPALQFARHGDSDSTAEILRPLTEQEQEQEQQQSSLLQVGSLRPCTAREEQWAQSLLHQEYDE